MRSPGHPWLRPSGYLGQTAGILALLIFLFLWLFPFRKKYRWLAWTGSMSRWMDAHVLVALALPLIAAIHASWRFDGLIGLGYLSMLRMRQRYRGDTSTRIPRSQSGRAECRGDGGATQRTHPRSTETGLTRKSGTTPDPSPAEGTGMVRSVGLMLKDDLDRRRAARVPTTSGGERHCPAPDRRAQNRLANREWL